MRNLCQVEQILDEARLQSNITFYHSELFSDINQESLVVPKGCSRQQYGSKGRAQFVREAAKKLSFARPLQVISSSLFRASSTSVSDQRTLYKASAAPEFVVLWRFFARSYPLRSGPNSGNQ